METGINNLKDFLQLAFGFVGAGSLAFAAYSYYLSRKQLNFAVIINCTERFQKILFQLESVEPKERSKAIGLYIDLCNEELFYFKHKYLPKEIIKEWIDGMIEYLPYFAADGKNLNKNLFSDVIEKHESFNKNPRIKKAFAINGQIEVTRKDLIENVIKNLKKID